MIVLDTNQLDRHSLDSPLIALLKVLSQSTNHRLALSVVTYNEHCAHYKHRLYRAYSQRVKSDSEVRSLLRVSGISFFEMGYEFTINANFSEEVDRIFSVYQDRLLNIFELIELDGVAAIEALRREAWRIAPASTSFDAKGNG